MIPLRLRAATGAATVFEEVNQWARENQLPEFWGGGTNFNPDYRVEGLGLNVFPLALKFNVVYKPESDEEIRCEKHFLAKLR